MIILSTVVLSMTMYSDQYMQVKRTKTIKNAHMSNTPAFHDSLQVVTSREIHRKVQVDITRHEFRHES